MKFALHLIHSRRFRSRLFSGWLAVVLSFAIIFGPITPVIELPTQEEPLKLGLEMSSAFAQFGNGYEYRRTITIQESQVTGGSSLSNFPVLVSLTVADLRTTGNGGDVTDAQGDDIIFTSDAAGSSVLDFEVERYTPTTGEIIAWVEVPSVSNSVNTDIYMFYGNSSVSTTQEDIPGTWDGNSYVGVYHMDGSSTLQLDSASSTTRHDGTVSGATANTTGKIGPAYDFDGTNDVITVTDQAELDLTNTGTFEAWVRTDDITTFEQVNTNWFSTNAPNGAGASDESGVDSVVVGETLYLAGMLCNEFVATFSTATWPLGGGAFSAWTSRTATGTPGTSGGCQIAADSDGKELWFATMSFNGTSTTRLAYSTSTLDFSSIGAWQSLGDLGTITSASEGSTIDMVITGDRAYFAVLALSGTGEQFRVGSIRLDGSGWTGWTTLATTNLAGGTGESCSASINTDGVKLYYSAHCNNGTTSTFGRAQSNLDFTNYVVWTNDTDPAAGVAGASEFNFVDSTLMGGHSYHAFYGHESTDENWVIASSSPEGGSVSAWIAASSTSSGLPDGAGAVETSDPAVESDGKTIYYSAFAHNGTAELHQIASTTLPAHPFISKRHAYEVIQVGPGYAFDWAGKPTTFGTTTGTTAFEHVVVSQDGTRLNYYINGSLYGSTTVNTDFSTNANDLLIGQGHRSVGTSIFFNGIIDEVRVSSGTYSADWIQTQYNNQNATSTFYQLGNEQTNEQTVVLTGFAGNVNQSTAVLRGTIVSGSSITEHGFATSTSPSFPIASSATTTLGAGSIGEFSGSVNGLQADTTYYFRAYATNGGTTYGTTRSFFTGNSTATRSVRLFEGYTVKFYNGDMLLHQQKQ
jgi:hypothetical protein